MPYYAVPGYVNAMAATYRSAATVTVPVTAPQKRVKVFELILGGTTSPNNSDCSFEVDLSRVTVTGTGVAVAAWTPTLMDAADAPATTTANIAYTTEPQTITANSTLYKIGMNQRATVRWIAAQESQYLITSNASGSGFVLRALSPSYNSSMGGQISFME